MKENNKDSSQFNYALANGHAQSVPVNSGEVSNRIPNHVNGFSSQLNINSNSPPPVITPNNQGILFHNFFIVLFGNKRFIYTFPKNYCRKQLN